MSSNTNSAKLAGKVALVTGGSRGIGAGIAKRLAADGASVALTYTKAADAAASVVKDIEKAGGKALAIQADAADDAAAKNAVEQTVAAFGRLDILVNNAGTAIPKPFEEATREELEASECYDAPFKLVKLPTVVMTPMANDQAVAARDVHAAAGPHRRGEHFWNAFETLELVVWLARFGVEG